MDYETIRHYLRSKGFTAVISAAGYEFGIDQWIPAGGLPSDQWFGRLFNETDDSIMIAATVRTPETDYITAGGYSRPVWLAVRD
jgi:hypothetical protein